MPQCVMSLHFLWYLHRKYLLCGSSSVFVNGVSTPLIIHCHALKDGGVAPEDLKEVENALVDELVAAGHGGFAVHESSMHSEQRLRVLALLQEAGLVIVGYWNRLWQMASDISWPQEPRLWKENLHERLCHAPADRR